MDTPELIDDATALELIQQTTLMVASGQAKLVAAVSGQHKRGTYLGIKGTQFKFLIPEIATLVEIFPWGTGVAYTHAGWPLTGVTASVLVHTTRRSKEVSEAVGALRTEAALVLEQNSQQLASITISQKTVLQEKLIELVIGAAVKSKEEVGEEAHQGIKPRGEGRTL